MLKTLFSFGPYDVCFLNILVIGAILFAAFILRKLIQRNLKRYLSEANIHLEGKRITYLRIFSQSAYVVGAYLSILSFRINNNNVSFRQFLDYPFISTSKIKLSFENVILALLIIYGARLAIHIIRLVLQRRFRKDTHYDKGTEYVYLQVAKYIVYTISFFMVLGALGVEPGIFLGGSAALLVGLGLGLQDVFKDMFSGFVLLFEGSIRVGDVIQINDGKSTEAIVAKILKINVRTTQIETRDGNVLIVPNTKLTQEYIENWSHGSTLSRFRIPVNIHYGSDAQMVSDLLIQAAMSHPKVKKTEPVQVRMVNFGENGLEMELIFWADQNWDINQYKSDIRFEIDRLFRHYGIAIPYPQREVSIFQSK
jgi:small-conductance mechanosensitive channel